MSFLKKRPRLKTNVGLNKMDKPYFDVESWLIENGYHFSTTDWSIIVYQHGARKLDLFRIEKHGPWTVSGVSKVATANLLNTLLNY